MIKIELICPTCNKKFIKHNNSQKYCTKKCKDKLRFKKYHDAHKEEGKEYKRIYNIINRKSVLSQKKCYREEHKEEIKKYMQEYRITHRNKIRKERRDYYHSKYGSDLNFTIEHNLRSRIGKVLKYNKKLFRTIELVNCTIEFLKKYLENKFVNGMTWNNYGKWHIDHIRPCASFDLSKPIEQLKCFHYTNLQPLWAKDNLEKSDKIL